MAAGSCQISDAMAMDHKIAAFIGCRSHLAGDRQCGTGKVDPTLPIGDHVTPPHSILMRTSCSSFNGDGTINVLFFKIYENRSFSVGAGEFRAAPKSTVPATLPSAA